MTLKNIAFEKIVGKGENAGNKYFLFFRLRFLLIYFNFESHLYCHLHMLSIWSIPKFCHLVKINLRLEDCPGCVITLT